MKNILVTGGAGYIGSHTVRRLLKEGFNVVVIDNLYHGHRESIPSNVKFYKEDLENYKKVSDICLQEKIDAVIHFAAFIEAGDSMKDPLSFYENNVRNTINLLSALETSGVRKIIFSSTAAVFGDPEEVPMNETSKKDPINIYGKTKLMIETILKDVASVEKLNYGILRYFNAAGADEDGDIGEDHDPETHLIPLILQVPLQKREKVFIFGNDYPTKDGTCIRDYIHVNDLADAHILALRKLIETDENFEYNLGSGSGYSVKEVIETCEDVIGESIPKEIVEKRLGDAPILIADSSKIKVELKWAPKYDLKAIVKTAWNWHKNNPEGYKK
ncbi:UDP-glucose 4-epimerase GalE [Thermoproteota archaeon]